MKSTPSVIYSIAQTAEDFQHAGKLFREYVASLGVDLSFQHFDEELQNIHAEYSKPNGILLLAYALDVPVACVGIRKFENEIAELKRMYVVPEFRNHKIGITLLQQSIQISSDLGYKKLRLDTLHNMTKAQQLYRASGFQEIPSYRFNPLEGTIYMEKAL